MEIILLTYLISASHTLYSTIQQLHDLPRFSIRSVHCV